MTPDDHYREAERLLAYVADRGEYDERRAQIIAQAQAHATLATIYRSTERLVEK